MLGSSASQTLNKSLFKETVSLAALRVPVQKMAVVHKRVKDLLFSRPRFKPVIDDPEAPKLNASKPGKPPASTVKLILLDNKISKDLDNAPAKLQSLVKEHDIQVITHEIELGYDQTGYEQILRRILPADVDVPSSYEAVGHIAHLNLREHHGPYKKIIGEVLLDKSSPAIKTIINKSNTIHSVYRNFEMEILAGEDRLETEVKQNGDRFRFNFADVYWNSRLEHEHERLVKTYFQPGHRICDMMAGVGPFAVPAARKGCTVYANDLNPASYKYLKINAELNKLGDKIIPHNKDARQFVRDLVASDSELRFQHVVMNLPATAVEFLDVLPQALQVWDQADMPLVHVYTFCKDVEDYEEAAIEKVKAVLGYRPKEVYTHDVRDVAPTKHMICVSFRLEIPVETGERPVTEQPDAKRPRVET